MKAEGKFRTFDTGAVRDTASKKPMLQLISPHLPFRLGEWLRHACQDRKPEPYPPRNWEKGMPFSETIGSMERHLQKWKLGEPFEEDHLAAIAFGAMALMHYEAEIKAGRLPTSLDDMPHYKERKPEKRGITGEQYADLVLSMSQGLENLLFGESKRCNSAAEAEILHKPFTEKLLAGDMMGQQSRCQKCLPVVLDKNLPAVTEQKTFYITGPMRGIPLFNFPAFDEAQARGEAMGYRIISPAQMDREDGLDPHNPPEITPELVTKFITRDTEVIMGLDVERGDGLALLPGWGASTGGGAEISLARWRGLQIVSARDFRPMLQSEVAAQMASWVQGMAAFLLRGEK